MQLISIQNRNYEIKYSYPSMFYTLFDSVSTNMEYKVYDIQKGEIPNEIRTDELYLIPGSRAGAYEDSAWIKELINFIRKAHAVRAKLVGVCFGHQVIAQALGGVVEKSDKIISTPVHHDVV